MANSPFHILTVEISEDLQSSIEELAAIHADLKEHV